MKQTVKPQSGTKSITTLEFESYNDSWVAEKKIKNFIAGNPLSFEIPRVENTQRIFTESFQNNTDSSYFYFSLEPEKYLRDKKLPSRICLLWDVSGSSGNRDIKKEEKILDAYFQKIKQTQIRLITFSNKIHKEELFEIKEGKWESLKNRLKSLQYDGGTQLGALDLTRYSCDEFLLCSDGLSNFGSADIKLSSVPVMAITSSQSADHSFLKYIARTTSGQYINALTSATDETARLLFSQPYRFLSASVTQGNITQLYPSVPTDFQKTFSMAGVIDGSEAEVTLNFGFGDEIVYSQKVRIQKKVDAIASDLLKRVWAQKKITELDIYYEKNKAEITGLGKKFSIVTRNTSLLVLDAVEDYVQHRIVPPAGKMRDDYYAKIEKQNEQQMKSKKEHLEKVINAFNAKIDWWNTEFKVDSSKLQLRNKKISETGAVQSDSIATIVGEGNVAAIQEITLNFSSQGYFANGGVVSMNYSVAKIKDKKGGKVSPAEIQLKSWSSDMPYMDKLRTAKPEELYAVYMELKQVYKNLPAFFLDAGDLFIEKGEKETGLRILSNLAEMQSENHHVLRVLAHRLRQLGYTELAVYTFRDVLKIREEEPQSYRDLGLALIERKEYQEAVDLLCKVVNRKWDERFPEIEIIAVGEINALIGRTGEKVKLDSLDARLIKPMPVDVRVVINWDSDNCDMDLWVTDPYKEKCMYSHNRTLAGGSISNDFTGGYGPEEFMIKKSVKGKYLVQVNYYGTREQTITGPTTVQAELYTNYGRSGEQKKEITLRLKESKEVIDIGELIF